jgi:hypothetical protein
MLTKAQVKQFHKDGFILAPGPFAGSPAKR